MSNKHVCNYQQQHSYENRLNQTVNMKKKFPDRIPVIIERAPYEFRVPMLDKNKYIVPMDITMGQLLYVVRSRLKLSPEISLFFFIDNALPASSTPISMIYSKYKSSDGFLYIIYNSENVFGK